MAVRWELDTPVLVSSHWQQLHPPALSALHASAHLGHCQMSLFDSAPSLACGAASTPLWDFWKLSPGPESAPGFLFCSHAMLPASTGVSEDKPQVSQTYPVLGTNHPGGSRCLLLSHAPTYLGTLQCSPTSAWDQGAGARSRVHSRGPDTI